MKRAKKRKPAKKKSAKKSAKRRVSTVEANKKLCLRCYTEWWDANGDVGTVEAMVSPDYIGHRDDGTKRDREGLKRKMIEYQTNIGGLHEKVLDVIAEGDKVMVRYSMHGTHTGVVNGVPPTGKRIDYEGVEIFRLKNGKIVEFWHFGPPVKLG
jgi:predicted ester cyclase